MAADAPEPEDVHPEYDRPTPRNIDEWSDEQLDEYNAATERRLEGEVERQSQDLSDEQERAIDALTDPDESDHATVPINDSRNVRVKTYLSAPAEDAFDRVADAERTRDARATAMIDAIEWLVEDEIYSDRAIWHEYYLRRGFTGLQAIFEDLTEPALNRIEDRSAVGNSQPDDADS